LAADRDFVLGDDGVRRVKRPNYDGDVAIG
jgi:hypothetical protein